MLAQFPPGNWDLMVSGLLLGIALVVAAILIALASKWRRGFREDRLTPSDQLAHFRSLYDRGVISQTEYDRLRNLLGGQLRQAFDVPSKPIIGEIKADTTNPTPTNPPAPPGPPESPADAPPNV